jgi:hypothetical protein
MARTSQSLQRFIETKFDAEQSERVIREEVFSVNAPPNPMPDFGFMFRSPPLIDRAGHLRRPVRTSASGTRQTKAELPHWRRELTFIRQKLKGLG